jgi:hypothetical protein
MKDNHSHITAVIDRSGSMANIREEAEGSINDWLAEQKDTKGTASLLLTQFEGNKGYEITHDGPLDAMGTYHMRTGGMTPLLDAIGKGVTDTGDMLDALDDDDKPATVFFVIVTDGLENTSREFTRTAVTNMIKHQETTYNWEFVFLAMGMDAVKSSDMFAGTHMHMNNVVRATGTSNSYAGATSSMSAAMRLTRTGSRSMGTSYGASVDDDGNVTTDD